MRISRRRKGAVLATLGLLGGLVPVLMATTPASAGSQTTTNACFSNATATFSDLPWTLTGTSSPASLELGSGNVTLASSAVQVSIPATLLLAGYNLGLLTVGVNNIPTNVFVSRGVTNATIAGVSPATSSQVDSFIVTVQTTISDPNGIPGSGDESATPLSVDQPLPDIVVTPTGGPIAFAQGPNGSIGTLPGLGVGGVPLLVNGSLFAQAVVGGGLIKANFDCRPGTTIISPPGGTSGTDFTPATAVPFATTTVTAPPTAPVCVPESVNAPANQTTVIDLTNNCTDVNSTNPTGPLTNDIDFTTLTASALTPVLGTLTPRAGEPGKFDYAAPANAPSAITFTFTVGDNTADGIVCNAGTPGAQTAAGGLGCISNKATTTITVLANLCNATTALCSLTEIVVQPVIGSTMTFEKAPGNVILTPKVLNGQAVVSTGAIQRVTVNNARGSAAAWNVTGYVTDLGNEFSPRVVAGAGVTIPACSQAGSLGGVLTSDGTPTGVPGNIPDRNCIPGDNLGWNPSAAFAHNRIAGDVSHIVAGPPHATSPEAWLALLVAAGNTPASVSPPTAASAVAGVDGLGGLVPVQPGGRNLCGAPVNQSGGTFTCDAALYLGIPASAGAGNYGGGLVLTLL